MTTRKRGWRAWVAVDRKTGRFLCGGMSRKSVVDYMGTYKAPVLRTARLVLDPQRAPKARNRRK